MVSPINYMLDTVPFTMCCYRYLDGDKGDCDASMIITMMTMMRMNKIIKMMV